LTQITEDEAGIVEEMTATKQTEKQEQFEKSTGKPAAPEPNRFFGEFSGWFLAID
jgi:hypothetical protein